MTGHFQSSLQWIDAQRDRMSRLVTTWSNINSGTLNPAGLQKLSTELQKEFSVLDAEISEIALSPLETINPAGITIQTTLGRALSIRKRPAAAKRVLLVIHTDTVYPMDHSFQQVESLDKDTLRGPGVADAKGGIAVLLIALQALEQNPLAANIGWEVLLNPDEEIGSPGSAPLLRQAAARNHLGLVFEPALPDGTLVGARKGSGNFTAVIRGRAAHAGRDFHLGRNAIHAAAAFVLAIDHLNGKIPGATFNVGKIDGGGPVNVVPDLAICRFNIRIDHPEDQAKVQNDLDRIVAQIAQYDGISIQLTGGFLSPPRPMDAVTTHWYQHLAACGNDLGMNLRWQSSGGASDANKLACAGLPVIDTLGPRGGSIHSPGEYLTLPSLTEKAKLSALLLLKLAAGDIQWPTTSQ